MAQEIMYYLFIEGKPYNYYETELEAEAEFSAWCEWNDKDEKEVPHEIKPFLEFNEEFPDPYDEVEY